MRHLLLAVLVLAPLGAAGAQTFSPISGPNDAIPSPVCDLINFGFCPQPPPPPPPFPDPEAEAATHTPTALPPPMRHRHVRHYRRHLSP